MGKVYGHGFHMIPDGNGKYKPKCNKCKWEPKKAKDYDEALAEGRMHQEAMRLFNSKE